MQLKNEEDISSNPYLMFKYSTRAEITRKYYETRIRQFFDFIGFDSELTDMERRCNAFADKGKCDVRCTISQVITFLEFQKDRVQKRRDNCRYFA